MVVGRLQRLRCCRMSYVSHFDIRRVHVTLRTIDYNLNTKNLDLSFSARTSAWRLTVSASSYVAVAVVLGCTSGFGQMCTWE